MQEFRVNYLIIDDEPIAHKLIENFAADLDYMQLAGNCHSAIDALPLLKSQQIDLIFLDINMPKLTGFQFLKTLQHPPQVIIISAHKEHALESYEYVITDYLLKPFNFERFFKAIQKVIDNLSSATQPSSGQQPLAGRTNIQPGHQNLSDHSSSVQASSSKNVSIFIKDDKKHHKVALDDLLYIKANGNFTSVYLKDKQILSQMKISDFENLLPDDSFSRVHRSYIIAHHAVTLVKANEILLGETVIPVGRVYKAQVEGLLTK